MSDVCAETGAAPGLMCVAWRSAPLEPPIDNASVRPTACIAATGCPSGSVATAAFTASAPAFSVSPQSPSPTAASHLVS